MRSATPRLAVLWEGSVLMVEMETKNDLLRKQLPELAVPCPFVRPAAAHIMQGPDSLKLHRHPKRRYTAESTCEKTRSCSIMMERQKHILFRWPHVLSRSRWSRTFPFASALARHLTTSAVLNCTMCGTLRLCVHDEQDPIGWDTPSES